MSADPGSAPAAAKLPALDTARLNRVGQGMLMAHASERLYMVRYLHLFAKIAPQAWTDEVWKEYGAMLVEKIGTDVARALIMKVATDMQQLIVHEAESFAQGLHLTEHYADQFKFTVVKLKDGTRWRIGLTPDEVALALGEMDPAARSTMPVDETPDASPDAEETR